MHPCQGFRLECGHIHVNCCCSYSFAFGQLFCSDPNPCRLYRNPWIHKAPLYASTPNPRRVRTPPGCRSGSLLVELFWAAARFCSRKKQCRMKNRDRKTCAITLKPTVSIKPAVKHHKTSSQCYERENGISDSPLEKRLSVPWCGAFRIILVCSCQCYTSNLLLRGFRLYTGSNNPLYRERGVRCKPTAPFSRLSERQLESTTGGMGRSWNVRSLRRKLHACVFVDV